MDKEESKIKKCRLEIYESREFRKNNAKTLEEIT